MKIQKISIKNYRSLKDVEIFMEDILAIVGQNNSGKSNILKALELFFGKNLKLVDLECFHNKNTFEPIEIVITFHCLNEWEADVFDNFLEGEFLTIGRRISCTDSSRFLIEDFIEKIVPEKKWLQQDEICGANINEWWLVKETLKIDDLDFSSDLGTSKPGVGVWKEKALNFTEKYQDSIEWISQTVINPTGLSDAIKECLPEYQYIVAVKNVSEESNKQSTFGNLLKDIFDKMPEENEREILEKLEDIRIQLNRDSSGKRIEEINKVECTLKNFMNELMDCDIEIKMKIPQLENIYLGSQIYVNDGIETSIESKGHGMQRFMILTILRTYLALKDESLEVDNKKSKIFAIEEPELYLHPQSQRTLNSLLKDISKGSDQVIYSTHSNLFVDISHFDDICIMKRVKKDSNYESFPTQLSMEKMLHDLEARIGRPGTDEGMRALYSHAFNPMVNEGFFAEKVVIVEGDSEVYSFPIYADALKYNFDANNVAIVHSNGKGPMDRLLRIFSGFNIPTYLIFDGDKDTDDKSNRDKTRELLDMVGDPIDDIKTIETKISDNYSIFDYDLETMLKDELDGCEELVKEAETHVGQSSKPLNHKYIANSLRNEVLKGTNPNEVLPPTIIEIINNIQVLSSTTPVLKEE